MRAESRLARDGWLMILLAALTGLGTMTLLTFGYNATRGWQRSSQLLTERDTNEVATLLSTAVMRDMRGVQGRVLANDDWADAAVSLADTSAQVVLRLLDTRIPNHSSGGRATTARSSS